MALLWIEGFEWAAASTSLDGNEVPSLRYEEFSIDNDSSIQSGRESGTALRISQDNYLRKLTRSSDDTFVVGFDLQTDSITTNHSNHFIAFYDSQFNLGFNIRAQSGDWEIRRGGAVLETISVPITASSWYHVEIKITVDNSTGAYEVRVDGIDVASDTNVDTQSGSVSDVNFVEINGGSQATYFEFDNFYIMDSTGSANNDFVGRQAVTRIYPDGAGNTTDFTPSTGSNYENVDDDPASDSDTTYNESSTSDEKDTYTYDDVTGLGTIAGIQINTVAKCTTEEQFGLHNVTRSGGSDYDSSEQGVPFQYSTIMDIREVDPDTSSAWTMTGINNAEYGVKVG